MILVNEMIENAKRFKQLMRSLKNIEKQLDTLVILQKATMPEPKVGKEEERILKLCDRKHTIDDIVQETGKKSGNVKVVLFNLRKKGLVRSIRSEGKTTYERI